MSAKHIFKVTWFGSHANVDITATSLYNASRSADKIARELGCTKAPRTIRLNGQVVEELKSGQHSRAWEAMRA